MSPEPGKNVARTVGPIAVDPKGEETYPDRERSSHRFIGPDYSLIDSFPFPDDTEASLEAQEEQLQQIDVLLKNAAHVKEISLTRSTNNDFDLMLNVTVESLISGHNVPTGFTSERQLWVEVSVYDRNNTLVFESGVLDANGDLYDHHSDEVRSGTAQPDPFLANFQSKNIVTARQYKEDGALVSDGSGDNLSQGENAENTYQEDAPQEYGTSEEVRTEYETIFPFDADHIVRRSLAPLEQRELTYPIVTNGQGPYQCNVRLRYRNLPPYMLRALHLHDLVERLQIFDLDTVEQTFSPQ